MSAPNRPFTRSMDHKDLEIMENALAQTNQQTPLEQNELANSTNDNTQHHAGIETYEINTNENTDTNTETSDNANSEHELDNTDIQHDPNISSPEQMLKLILIEMRQQSAELQQTFMHKLSTQENALTNLAHNQKVSNEQISQLFHRQKLLEEQFQLERSARQTHVQTQPNPFNHTSNSTPQRHNDIHSVNQIETHTANISTCSSITRAKIKAPEPKPFNGYSQEDARSWLYDFDLYVESQNYDDDRSPAI